MEQQLAHFSLEKLLEHSNSLFQILDSNLNIIEISNAWCLNIGYEKVEIKGKSWIDFIFVSDVQSVKNIIQGLRKELLTEVNFQYRCQSKQGNLIWLESVAYLDGERLIVSSTDITSLKKTEDDLNQLKNTHNAVLDTITFGLYYVKNTKVVWANKAFYKMFDVTEEEVINKDLVVFYKKVEDFHRLYEDAYEALVKGEIYEGEVELCVKPGVVDWVRFIGKTLVPGKPKEGTVWLIEIITEQKKNAENLNLFKKSIDNSGDAIYWLDKQANFTYFNKVGYQMLGYTKEEFSRLTLFDINPNYSKEHWDELWEDCEKRKEEKNILRQLESTQIKKDGELFPVEVSTNHFWINENEYHIARVRDITERNRNELILHKFKASIDYALDGVYWINREGGFDYVNDQACNMLGYTREELLLLKLPDIDSSVILEDHKKRWDEAFAQEISFGIHQNSIQIKKDGVLLPVEVNAIFVRVNKRSFLITYVKDISERKRQEEIILKNQKLLVESQRIAKMGSWEIDVPTGKLSWNKETFEIFGYEKDEVEPTMELFYRLINPNDVQIAVDHLQDIYDHLRVEEFECRTLDTDGEDKYLLIAGDIELDEEGKLVRIFGIVQDITEKKISEQQLIKAKQKAEESEERFKALHNASFGGLAVHDKGVILDCNQGLSEITGYEIEELIYKNGLLLIAPDDREFVMNNIKSGNERPYVVNGIRKNGESYPVRLEARNIPYKGKLVRSVEFRDITDQRKAEKEILEAKERAEESEYFLQESQRSGNIGSFKINLLTEEWIATETLLRIIGETGQVCKYEEMFSLIHPDDYLRVAQYFKNEILIEKKPFDIEYRIYKKSDHQLRWLHAVGKLYLNDENEVAEVLGTIQDITERKLIEEERKKMNVLLENSVKERTEQLQQANRDLEAFAYSVSHDLRAPIRHIDGFLRLMYNAMKPVDAKIESYYEKIIKSSKGMSVMIDELLSFSRLGRTKINYSDVNLQQVVAEILEQFKPDYVKRNIQWNIHNLPIVQGDPVLLKIVFENLISNAIKYTSKRENAIIEIGKKNNTSSQFHLFVKDNGAGFDMAYKDKLFGVFQRLHKSDEFEGVGIGLANVKQIITKHNGTIDVVSEVDKGTTFIITIPK